VSAKFKLHCPISTATQINISNLTFGLIATPWNNVKGVRIGTVVEWQDRTAEVAIEQEINHLVEPANLGDVTTKIDETGKKDFFLNLTKGLNSVVGNVNNGLIDVLGVTAPLPESTRNQILSIIGIGFSDAVAFSSTSFVTHVMAAITMRVIRPFNVGDFVTVGDYFGKVSERGLFDTEIQTESRELISIPNSVFILTPVKVTRGSGVIIATNLSLGYDVHHAQIEPLLLQAALAAGLEDPYVHIISLNDFSVSYRINGLLAEVKTLLTSRSILNACVLDSLHRHNIEIVSPTFTRHINQPLAAKQIPPEQRMKKPDSQINAEDIAFDKANQAQALAELQLSLAQKITDLSNQLSNTENLEDKARAALEAQLGRLHEELASHASKTPDSD
jgi:small conductance mechanosensitive channel